MPDTGSREPLSEESLSVAMRDFPYEGSRTDRWVGSGSGFWDDSTGSHVELSRWLVIYLNTSGVDGRADHTAESQPKPQECPLGSSFYP